MTSKKKPTRRAPNAKPLKRAQLLRDFCGTYHVMSYPDDSPLAFSLTHAQAVAFCKREGYVLV